MLNLSEIFYSIQGEGPLMGRPAIFIRLSGCNLRCEWGASKCDTPYTSWEPENNPINCDEVIQRIAPLLQKTAQIIITGGEPTLQSELPQLTSMLAALGCIQQIETNGTGPIPTDIGTIVCSPKLSDSTPADAQFAMHHEKLRLKLHPSISGTDPRLYLKFVVSRNSDFNEITDIVRMLNIPNDRVYLMAEGSNPDEHRKVAPEGPVGK